VVHIGCGLDTRFERLDNSQVEWYDLELPDVIALRRQLIGGEGRRYRLLGCSVLDNAWLESVSASRPHRSPFLAEGVSVYFEEAQVKSLMLILRDHFPKAELVFDAFSPLHIWGSNHRLAKFGVRLHWGLSRGQEIEGWEEGIQLLDDWGYLDRPEPRLAYTRWVRHIPLAARGRGGNPGLHVTSLRPTCTPRCQVSLRFAAPIPSACAAKTSASSAGTLRTTGRT
jgi:O-methyltransferase involved in polyketide biosynthesis